MALAGSAAAARSATTPGRVLTERELPIGNERGRDDQPRRPRWPEVHATGRPARGGGRIGPPGASLGRAMLAGRRQLGIRGDRLACSLLAAASDLREDSARLGLGLGIELGSQRVGERAIELDRGSAPSALAIGPHQAAHGCLMQRLKPQNPHARLDRALGLAALGKLRHQPGENIDRLIPVARRLRAAPGFELFALDVRAHPGIRRRRAPPLLPARPGPIGPRGGETPRHRPRKPRRRARCLRLRRQQPDARYRQALCAGSRRQLRRLSSSGLVGGIAPQQRHQLPARLAVIRAEGEIGEQHALALSGRCHSLAARKHGSARSRQAGEATSAPAPPSHCSKLTRCSSPPSSNADEVVGAHGAAEFRPAARAPVLDEAGLAHIGLEAFRLAHRRV